MLKPVVGILMLFLFTQAASTAAIEPEREVNSKQGTLLMENRVESSTVSTGSIVSSANGDDASGVEEGKENSMPPPLPTPLPSKGFYATTGYHGYIANFILTHLP